MYIHTAFKAWVYVCIGRQDVPASAPMVRRNIVIPDELDARFRKALAVRKGIQKGNISEAVCEAIEHWIRNPKRG